jgi:acetolactate synthase-1/2/3 large subunit
VKLTGAQIIMECLLREGVDTIFGYPGGANLPMYDTLPQYASQIRHVQVRHEQSAAHAAEAYSRVTGKAGVCWATSGPGATNLVTGIADAWMDSIPLVCITGQVPTTLIGGDGLSGRRGSSQV